MLNYRHNDLVMNTLIVTFLFYVVISFINEYFSFQGIFLLMSGLAFAAVLFLALEREFRFHLPSVTSLMCMLFFGIISFWLLESNKFDGSFPWVAIYWDGMFKRLLSMMVIFSTFYGALKGVFAVRGEKSL